MAVVFLMTCSPEEPKTKLIELTVENKPSAKPEDDTSSSGVYKGTFLGSTGTFKLVITESDVFGILSVDDEIYLLKSDDIKSSDLNGPISSAVFTDPKNIVKLIFSVGAAGSDPTVELTIVGHDNIQVVIMKELSHSQVVVYEGYYSAPDTLHRVQVIADLNLVFLVGEGVGSATYRVREKVDLGTGSSEPTLTEWQGTITYEDYSVYNFETFEPYDSALIINPEIRIFGKTFTLAVTDKILLFKGFRHWTDNNNNMEYTSYDSARLERKL
jgi:hypothetical protein